MAYAISPDDLAGKFPYWGTLPSTHIDKEDLEGQWMIIRPGFPNPRYSITGEDGIPPESYPLCNLFRRMAETNLPDNIIDLTPNGSIPVDLSPDDCKTLFFFLHYTRFLVPMCHGMRITTKIILEKRTVDGH